VDGDYEKGKDEDEELNDFDDLGDGWAWGMGSRV
jgi:hypothetical protein